MRYLGGRINFLGDSFSRNPEDRDEAQERLLAISANPKQVLGLFNAAEFHDEVLGFELLPEAEWKEGAGALQRVIRVLFVPTYELQDAEDRLQELSKNMTLEDGKKVTFYRIQEHPELKLYRSDEKLLYRYPSDLGFTMLNPNVLNTED